MTNPDQPQASALVLLATGAEEMEVVITVDVLRRANVAVTIAGLNGGDPVACSRGMVLCPDKSLAAAMDAVPEPDVVVLPGGAEGARRLGASAAVGELLDRQVRAGRTVAAICAAPAALVEHGIGHRRRMTSHPSVQDIVAGFAEYHELPVVEDADHGAGFPLITSRGPGTAFEFALVLVARLRSAEVAAEVRAPMMLG